MRTIRQAIGELLEEGELSARDISQRLGISEKEVVYHIPHVRSSVLAQSKKFVVIAARCMTCGYEFEDRRRVTKPGRCPRCRGEHIEDPRYRVDS
jgi:predicted Zn-ribbon and HTH transcriptional regulator